MKGDVNMCGGLFGGGSVKTPKIQQAAPTPTTQVSDVPATGDTTAEQKNRRKKGFDSTNLSTSILGEATGKKTLGG